MAAACHVRSYSFPSRPCPRVDEHLSRLRSSEAASTSSSSIARQLYGLRDLQESVDSLLQSHHNQQAVAQEQNKKTVEDLLDGSLRLLDICNIAKETLSQTRQSLNEIQSILRRKRGDLSSEIKKYLASRKCLRKSFQKVLKGLKTAENKFNNDEALGMLKEAEAVASTVLESVLCFISCSGIPRSKWSLAAKLMNKKRVAASEEEEAANEFARIDAAFNSFIDRKSDKSLRTEDVQSLEACIQDLEEGLECHFRSLIKVRVSVLNIVGQ